MKMSCHHREGRREECGGHRTEPGGAHDGRWAQVNEQKAQGSREGEVCESLGATSEARKGKTWAGSKPSLASCLPEHGTPMFVVGASTF